MAFVDLLSPEFFTGVAGTLTAILLPLAFNRWLLPLLSTRARLRKYLKIINATAVSFRAEFPERFDDPTVTWTDHAQAVLLAAANAEPLAADDAAWQLAQKLYVRYGPGLPEELT